MQILTGLIAFSLLGCIFAWVFDFRGVRTGKRK